MPNAVPFQHGLIGLYNNTASNPGVYVSWDSNTLFNSTQSLIFKGAQNTDYRFPLVINSYSQGALGKPLALGAGNTYVYCLNSSGIIAYQKSADVFNTVGFISNNAIESSFTPVTIKVGQIGLSEVIFVGYSSFFDVLTFSGSAFTKSNGLTYNAITGITTNNFGTFDLGFSSGNVFFGYGQAVYAGAINLDSSNNVILGSGTTGIIINSSNGLKNPIKKIANFDNYKIATIDSANIISEFVYNGNINAGDVSTQWVFNYSISPNATQNWSALVYNHFGIIIVCDSFNNTINTAASSNITTNTQNYGTFDGFTYQVISNTTTTTYGGTLVNTIGGTGIGYLQFNTPDCVCEDPEYNVIVGDYNNRLTYIPTALDYVATVPAPYSEYIDSAGNPADVYYVKESTYDYSGVFSIPPFTGDELLLKSSVLYELNALLKIEVVDEEPLFGWNRQTATLAYGDLVTDPAPQVRITVSTNGGQRSSMYTLNPYVPFYNSLDQSNSDPFDAPALANNYPNGLLYRFTNEGKIYFYDNNGNPVSLQEYDTILVNYYVKLFTNAQINNALYLALQSINAQPGLNKISNVASVPFWYDQTLVSGATYYLLRQLLVGLNSRERRLLILDPESGLDFVSLKDTANMYKDEFNELLKQLPIAVRPTMGTIAVPEYAFPGGRSRLFRDIWSGAKGN
jgi:hypothetical protein